MTSLHPRSIPRRSWLTTHATGLAMLVSGASLPRRWVSSRHRDGLMARTARATRLAQQAERLDPAPWQALAQRAVDAARATGARYADVRLTRLVHHGYDLGSLAYDGEFLGAGVRVLVDGCWGFSASAVLTADEMVRLAQDAVGQAKENATGTPSSRDPFRELGPMPVATGTWATPVQIDPFTVSIEEKEDFIQYWRQCAQAGGVGFFMEGLPSWLMFARHEWVMATSDGTLVTQTLYESGGELVMSLGGSLDAMFGVGIKQLVHGIEITGAGWEHFLEANIPEQLLSGQIRRELEAKAALASTSKPATVGKYTLVCDGATMAALAGGTLGVATQLDRALGYEANASGTSWLDDPLAMVGNAHVAAPGIGLTANRSAPRELATVKWDAEGVTPEPFPLITDGVLVDFQTTREQAGWLAPYYTKHGTPIRSHGCAAAESAHFIPMQQSPNLALTPNPSAVGVEDLIADVKDGLLLEGCQISEIDAQVRTGLLDEGFQGRGRMREIKNGRVGNVVQGGAVFFTSQALWKAITALAGVSSEAAVGVSQFDNPIDPTRSGMNHLQLGKGQPLQLTSHSVRAVAATIPNQPLIQPGRKV